MKFGHRPFPPDFSGIARLLRRLAKADDGIETIEFAIVALTLFVFVLGIAHAQSPPLRLCDFLVSVLA